MATLGSAGRAAGSLSAPAEARRLLVKIALTDLPTAPAGRNRRSRRIASGFDTAMLEAERNETVQIGYRLANRLGHEAVYSSEQQPSNGEPDYFWVWHR